MKTKLGVDRIPERFRALVFVAIIVIVGSTVLFISKAASSVTASEAENGSVTGGAGVVNDSNASGGKAVAFGAAITGTGVYSFASSGLTGGGFQNVIAISPFKDGNGNRPYLLGADVSGIHVSTSQGRLWTPHNSPGHVAALLWSDTTRGKAYALADEGFYTSSDWGVTWNRKAGATNADANGSYFVSGSEHPRPTGNMIAQDNSGPTKYVWVATANQGIKQSSNDGNSWNDTALAGDHIRGIASDPNNPDVLYVAIENVTAGDPASNPANTGIWRSTNARSATMTFTKMTNYPGNLNTPEELWAINNNGTTTLLVAGGKDGAFMYSGTTWTTINSGLDTGSGGSWYESITGYRDTVSGNLVMYIGATATKATAGIVHERTILKSVNGGSTWASISDDPHITLDWNMYGTTVPSWLKQVSYHNFAANSQWTASDLAIDPDSPNTVLVAGRGGAWFGTQAGANTTWQPADNGLMVTVNMAVATDPAIAGNVVVGNMDYTVLVSSDNGASFTNNKPGAAQSTGDVVVFDSNPATGGGPTPVYLAASKRGANTGLGNIYSNPNPFSGGTWTDENLPVNSDIPAMSVGHDGSGARIILAGVTNNGLWRKAGTTWGQVTGGPFATGAGIGYFVWKANTATVYAIDSVAVWRSDSAGAQGSWIKLMTAGTSYGTFNALALDPVNSNYLYVSNGSVKRITNAETSTGTSATAVSNISSVGNAGPIVISKTGQLFVHDRGGQQLVESADPRASSPSFVKVSDSFYGENNGNIRSMAIGLNGYIYTADNGQGVTVGKP